MSFAAHASPLPQVDGGLGPATIDQAAAAGANNIVAGSSVFKPGVDRREPIAAMRRSLFKLGQGLSDADADAAQAAVRAGKEGTA